MKKTVFFFATALLATSTLFVASCDKEEPTPEPTPTTPDPYATQKAQIKETYANMAFAVYDDSYQDAIVLNAALHAFVAAPSTLTHQAAKNAWLDARETYGQSEIFRFVDGPIDNPTDGPEGLINAWPMDEAFVDYVQGNANAGIINDLVNHPTITENTILSTNEFGGEENISAGYHAIEFLLWGQDLSSSSAGARPYTDYVTDGSGTASNQARRGAYLGYLGDILEAALKQVRDAWDPAISGSYRTTFINMENSLALRKMFNSMRVMSGDELSGERIYVAYENQDQEDEHSCFSDNTHRDIALNAKGIVNLYNGSYTRSNGTVVSGYSLKDLVAVVNATQNTALLDRFTTTETLIGQMYIPFDQAIVLPGERPKVLEVVQSLQTEHDQVVAIALNFGITF